MKRSNVALAMSMALLTVAMTLPARGQSSLIILTNADVSTTVGLSGSSGLVGVLGAVQPRPILVSSDDLRYTALVPAPAELVAQIGRLGPRPILLSSDQLLYRTLSYPVAFFGDTTPATLVGNAGVMSSGLNVASLSWQTNEWTTSVVHYGIQPGALNLTATDPLFGKAHMVSLPGLTSGVTYYYQITSTDRSGNVANSIQATFTFSSQIKVFLPLLRR